MAPWRDQLRSAALAPLDGGHERAGSGTDRSLFLGGLLLLPPPFVRAFPGGIYNPWRTGNFLPHGPEIPAGLPGTGFSPPPVSVAFTASLPHLFSGALGPLALQIPGNAGSSLGHTLFGPRPPGSRRPNMGTTLPLSQWGRSLSLHQRTASETTRNLISPRTTKPSRSDLENFTHLANIYQSHPVLSSQTRAPPLSSSFARNVWVSPFHEESPGYNHPFSSALLERRAQTRKRFVTLGTLYITHFWGFTRTQNRFWSPRGEPRKFCEINPSAAAQHASALGPKL